MPGLPEYTVCNLCGSADAQLLYRSRDYRLQVDNILWNVVRCRSCGLGYLNPRPDAEEIERYYPPEYYASRSTHTRRYELQARYLNGPPGRLLDVGTAGGHFLTVMADRGWDVIGIEPSDTGQPAGEVPVVNGRFPEESTFEPANFDAITAWAVFEHLHDPAAAFAECSRLLRPAGKLIVQVPNLRSILSRWALGEDIPRHLYFFCSRSLAAYGERSGLRLTRVHHPTDLRPASGRGLFRLWLSRATGKSDAEHFEVYRTAKAERFRRWPIYAVAWTMTSAAEHVLLGDHVARITRTSGQIVAEFEKSTSKLG